MLLGVISAAGHPALDPSQPTQYDVEAAYLFDFGRFISWPQPRSADAPFVICILGENPFGSALDSTIAGEVLRGRKVEDRRITRAQDALPCSILYISSSEASRLNKILAAIQHAPVLTVSDMPDFAEHGGMVQFVLRDGRVRFEVNLASAQQVGLSMSSELLKVAVEVFRGKENR